MEVRVKTLRRRIATYHRQLQDGVDSERAAQYVAQILSDEAELRAITSEEEITNSFIPAHPWSNAQHYRQLADREGDPERAELFRGLAASFERDADFREKNGD